MGKEKYKQSQKNAANLYKKCGMSNTNVGLQALISGRWRMTNTLF